MYENYDDFFVDGGYWCVSGVVQTTEMAWNSEESIKT